ncbi:hypothetical protein ABER61_27750 [Brevibacillus formosus]|uniref:Uncharacterized protein n=1 Tax=Brevibacillus formosus TaxID=54913 RepID=A0A837KMI2_9BACL|nr:hypothetical protein [Brevibacillus formosus]KLH97469.1 hypothetical protein AA984_20250 [Brevibacillus formosus]MED1955573.1 hypothetical protein [Brevibacillus formosus]PSJ95182.1 hypothetical protein C7R91_16290 [Brevibacillus formosus]GED60281.1 hypothetical protein BFO01nite_44130 [Brevibacillus formosus]
MEAQRLTDALRSITSAARSVVEQSASPFRAEQATPFFQAMNQQLYELRQMIRDIESKPLSFSRKYESQPSSHAAPASRLSVSTGAISPFRFATVADAPVKRTEKFYGKRSNLHPKVWEEAAVNMLRNMMSSGLHTLISSMDIENWESAKSLNRMIKKAERNFLFKDTNMMDLAQTRVSGRTTNQKQVEEEALGLREYLRSGVKQDLRDIALTHAVSLEEVTRAYYTSSRQSNDPHVTVADIRKKAAMLPNDPLAPQTRMQTIWQAASLEAFNIFKNQPGSFPSLLVHLLQRMRESQSQLSLAVRLLRSAVDQYGGKAAYVKARRNLHEGSEQRRQEHVTTLLGQSSSPFTQEALEIQSWQLQNLSSYQAARTRLIRNRLEQKKVQELYPHNDRLLKALIAEEKKLLKQLHLLWLKMRDVERQAHLLASRIHLVQRAFGGLQSTITTLIPAVSSLDERLRALSDTSVATDEQIKNMTSDLEEQEKQLQKTREALKELTEALSTAVPKPPTATAGPQAASSTPAASSSSSAASRLTPVAALLFEEFSGDFKTKIREKFLKGKKKEDKKESDDTADDTDESSSTPDIPTRERANRDSTPPDDTTQRVPLWRKGLKNAGKLLKGFGLIGVGITALNFVDSLNKDWLQPMFMSDSQRQSRVLENQKGLVDDFVSIDKMPPGLKHAFFASTFLTGLGDGLINFMGGTAPSWGDYYNAFEAAYKYDGKDLKNELNKTFQPDSKEADLELEKLKAKYKKDDEKEKYSRFIDIDGDGSKLNNTAVPSWDEVKTLDLGKEVVGYNLELLDLKDAILEANFKKKKAELLAQGKTEDSPEMRAIREEYYSGKGENNKTSRSKLDKLTSNIPDNTDAKLVGQLALAGLDASHAQNNLDKINENASAEIESAMSKVSSDLANKEHQYYIDRSEALLAGHRPNSEFIKKLEEKYLRSTIESLDAGNSDMDRLLAEYQNNETFKKSIEDFKKGLEKAKYDNLVSLHMSKQPTKGTFNMPEGLQPLTYWGMQTANGTHSTYDFTYGGDSNVNITIANMSGTEADLQRLGSTVSEAVRSTQASLSTELSQQVRSGIATSYTRL